MRYGFNSDKFVNSYLPAVLRLTNRVKLFQSFLKPVENLVADFNSFRQEIIFKTKYSCQQKSLTALLNKKFDDTHSRIRIVTASDIKPIWYSYNSNEINPNPAFSFNQIKDWVDYYRFSSLNFIFQVV